MHRLLHIYKYAKFELDWYLRSVTMLWIRPSGSSGKAIPSYTHGQMNMCMLCFTTNSMWGPCVACSQNFGPFWGQTFVPNTIFLVRDATTCSIFYFMVCGVWSSVNIIQCTYTSFTSIAHHGVWVLMEFEFCQPIKLDKLTK
jgi:hypothetical protein